MKASLTQLTCSLDVSFAGATYSKTTDISGGGSSLVKVQLHILICELSAMAAEVRKQTAILDVFLYIYDITSLL
jgi:hypothetical protein